MKIYNQVPYIPKDILEQLLKYSHDFDNRHLLF